MNKALLKGLIVSAGMTQRDVAGKIGISLSRFNAKINNTGNAEFTLGEVRKLCELLPITSSQIYDIFLK